MAYKFPLAPVLRMREITADREEQSLARILAEQGTVQLSLARIDAEIARTTGAREHGLAGAMRAAHLRSSYSCVDELRQARTQLQRQLAELEVARAEQSRACEAAYQARELLCSLRQTHQHQWHTERGRAEQRQADEAFLRRFCQ